MRIRELRLIRYGKFTDRHLALPAAERDFHLIVGPNEAGKSTVRSAIAEWLYRIDPRTPLAFLHPMPELRLGGVLERPAQGGEPVRVLDFERTKGNKNTLRTPKDGVLPDSALQPWLGSLEQAAFERMHALDHAALVEGGAGILSASDDIGRMLFQSAAGIEHLGPALQRLQDEADAWWGPRKKGDRAYYQALEAFEAAHAEFRQSALRTHEWKALHEDLVKTEAALGLAQERGRELSVQRGRLERMRRVRPLVAALDDATRQLDALQAGGAVPLLPADAAQVLAESRERQVVLAADIQRLEQEVAGTTQALQDLPVDREVLALAADIHDLNERRLQFRGHDAQLARRRRELQDEWSAARQLALDLGWPVEDEAALRARLPPLPVRLRLARLLKERPALWQSLRHAESQLRERRLQLEQARVAQARLPEADVPPGLAAALDLALQSGDPTAAEPAWQRETEDRARRMADGLSALHPWQGDAAQLRAMAVPEASYVQALIDAQRRDEAQGQTQQSALTAKAEEVQRLELELQQLVRTFHPVSQEQVQAARATREAAWQQIRSEPGSLALRAADYEARVTEADLQADARLDRAQHEAERQSRAQRLEQLQLERAQAESRLMSVQARLAGRAAEWQALAAAGGLPALPLELAPAWLRQRVEVLGLLDEAAVREGEHRARQAVARAAHQALWAQLHAPAEAPGVAPEPAACIHRAREHIASAHTARGERDSLERQLREGQASLTALEATLRQAQAEWEGHMASWQATTLAAGHAAEVHADQVETEGAVMAEIAQRLDRMAVLRHEHIEALQTDLEGLQATARRLAERLAPAQQDAAPADIALALAARLETSRQAERQAQALQAALQRAGEVLAQARHGLLAVQARLVPLMSAAGVADPEALGPAIERSARRRAMEADQARALALLEPAGDGLSLAALRAELAAVDPDTARAQQVAVDAEAQSLLETINRLGQDKGTQQSALQAHDGAPRAAEAEARRQEAIAAMAEAAQQYLRLQTAWRLLKWSTEKFRETQQGPMLARASAHFRTLTLGSFGRLLVDADGSTPRLLGLRPGGEAVEVAGMSEGSRDQLYLALRLAALELQVEQGRAMPLIADDLFVNFDDRRTEAGLQVLGEASRRMQVIFLTHHEHLVPLARQVLGPGLNVVTLEP